MNSHAYEYRKFILAGIALLIVLCYIGRLAFLQLSDEEYKSRADNNAFFNNIIFPARGVIYDRITCLQSASIRHYGHYARGKQS